MENKNNLVKEAVTALAPWVLLWAIAEVGAYVLGK